VSTTGPANVARVYALLGDDPDDPIIPYETIRQMTNQCVREIASPMQLGVGAIWVDNIISVVPGVRDLAFPTTVNGILNVEYEQVVSLRYHGTFLPLRKCSRSELDATRALGATANGRQAIYTMWEDPTQTVQLQFPGFPVLAESLDAFIELVPSDWPTGSATPPTIPFSKRAADALALLTAAKTGEPLNPDKLNALRLDLKTFERWGADAKRILAEEKIRVICQKLTYGPRNFAWVAGWVV
jgi:hypothetical protein